METQQIQKENNLTWLRENVKIFLDENIPNHVYFSFKSRGYQNIENVCTCNLRGANDNQILDFLKNNKYILITHDKRFQKMAEKYNNFAILFLIRPHNYLSGRTYAIRTELKLQQEYKNLRKYYE